MGGTANWDATAGTKWSTTSGGASGAAVPTAADDVYFDAASGAANATITAAAVCRKLDCTGYTGTITHNGGFNLTIGTTTNGAGNIALKLVAGMTWTQGTSSPVLFARNAGGTAQTVAFGGKTMAANMTFGSASSGSWQIVDTFDGPSATITVSNGTLDTNGQTCNWLGFASSNGNVRTLTFGASAINLSGTATVWTTSTTTNLTVTANTATVTGSGAGGTYAFGGKDWNGLSVVLSGSGTTLMSSAGTFANVTRTGTAVKTDVWQLGANLTITGTLTINGNSSVNRLSLESSVRGTARTMTAATVSVSNTDFMDITGAGAGSWNLSAITGGSGDSLGNTGITFTTSATQTYAGGTNNWSTAAAWTSRVPLPQDDVVVNTTVAGTLTVDMPRLGRNIDFTSYTRTFTTSTACEMYGNLTISSGMTLSGTATISLSGRSTQSLTLPAAGKTFTQGIAINGPGSTYTLMGGNITNSRNLASAINIQNGTFDANDFDITLTATNGGVNIAGGNLIMGNGTWTIAGAGAGNHWARTTGTVTAEGSTIDITTATVNSRTFAGGGATYNKLRYATTGSAGALVITGSNTFAELIVSDTTTSKPLTFTAGTTTTISTAAGWQVNGVSGALVVIASVTAATHTISIASGTVSSDYLSLTNSIATGGATFYAGANSTDNGGNTGWNFTSGATTLTLPLIASAAVLYEPTIAPGAVTLSLPLIASITQTFSPTLTPVYSVTLPLINSTNTLYEPTVAVGAVGLALPYIDSTTTLFGMEVEVAGLEIALPFISGGAASYPDKIFDIEGNMYKRVTSTKYLRL